MHPTRTLHTPVLVVGAGPAGLVTAIELARAGVRPLLIERHPSTSIFPRATGVSTRSMEIFRGYGLESAVRQGGWRVIPREARVRQLDDPAPVEGALGFPDEAASRAVSPTSAAISPQDHLEPVLLEHLRELGGRIAFSTELVSFEEDDRGINALVRDRTEGTETKVRAGWLVGADGHGSAVRAGLGIEMEGPADLGRYLSMLFRADLSDVLGDRRYGLYMVGEEVPGRPPTVVVPSGADDRYVLGVPLPPGMDDAAVSAAFPLDRCVTMVRDAIGRPDIAVELLATGSFAFAAQVATRWREGRAFLVGDAAHRMTPRGGRGMNTAIADGHDLGWKLAAVVNGQADPGLLDTYEAERGPIGRRNVALSMAPGGGGTEDGLLEDLGPLDALPGQRAPHVWVASSESTRRSTLDLAGTGFALIATGKVSAWERAVDAMPFGVCVTLHATEDAAIAMSYRLASGGAVLIRPDGIIAARTDAIPPDPRAWLAAALGAALHRPEPTVARRRVAAAASLARESFAMLAMNGGWPYPVASHRNGAAPARGSAVQEPGSATTKRFLRSQSVR